MLVKSFVLTKLSQDWISVKAYIVLYSWMWWCYMAATCRDGSIEPHPWMHPLLHPVSCNCAPDFIYLPISTKAFHLSM